MATPKPNGDAPPTNDHRPNSGLREGDIAHAEVNAALSSCTKTVIFGQQNRLRNGIVMPDEKLTRFHAGHDLVKFFYRGMNKLPEFVLDALLENNISVTLVTGRDLLVFRDVRNHQAFHIGFTRKTLYMPEGVLHEAIEKGYDSWSVAEAVLREAWPLLDYLLILEFIRRAQLRLRTHMTLGSQEIIKKALRYLNSHLVETEGNDEDDFKNFFRHYCNAFFKVERSILKKDPYELADAIYDEKQERAWGDVKCYDITAELDFPTYFDLDRDILHPAAFRAADIKGLPLEPQTTEDILHDICDAARFRILRQTKTARLLDMLLERGRPGILGLIDVVAGEYATSQRFLTLNQGDGFDTVTLFKEKLQALSTSPGEGTLGSISHDFRDLLNYEIKRRVLALFHRFTELPAREQTANQTYLRNLLLKMVPLQEAKKQKEHLKDETLPGAVGAASDAEARTREMLVAAVMQARRVKTLLEIAERLIGPEDPELRHRLLLDLLRKLDRHPAYHTTVRDQIRDLTGNQRLSLGENIQQQVDTLYRAIPKYPYRLSSDPSRLRTCLDGYLAMRQKAPNNRTMFSLLAGVFIRLDRSDSYGDFVERIRIIGIEAQPALLDVVTKTNRNDPVRQIILHTARELLQSLQEAVDASVFER